MILNPNRVEYYGDQTRWFIGTVIDINDPLQLGRIKVRIFGIHSENTEDVGDEDLPWAQTIVPITEGGSSGLGANVGIKERAQVFGFFMDGVNSQLPVVLGSLSKIEKPSIDIINRESQSTAAIPKVNTNKPDKDLLKGESNIEKCFNFFISAEGGAFTPQQAAGIIGNFMQESSVDPKAVNTSEGSIGIAQWNPGNKVDPRFARLKQFSAAKNLSYLSLYAQLLYVKHELETLPYLGMSKLRQAKTASEAAEIFCKYYERPNAKYAHVNQRIAYAKEILEKMT